MSDLEQNTTMPMVGKSFAGAPFEGEWPALTTVRIMTGAKIPEGCDAVIMQENTSVKGDNITFLSLVSKPT
ncbi:molybdopterin biosynthesis protein MoeA [Vibrio variabilis]|uniref:Molybdopterin biosynthesis protein MoeA n=1 Tax=Vibrio variabilis TaxID=990271 RepID=A0ABQ0JIC1_9VIBR|nr:molybdopterin biosynthesis protein MoeA [Vibrio variabilis]